MRRSTRLVLAILPATLIIGSALTPAQAGGQGPQLDLLIKGGAASNYIGGDIYNDNGAGQTKSRISKPGETDRFRLRYENDGDTYDAYLIAGDGSQNGFQVRYLFNGNDVTGDVTSGNFFPPGLDPGEGRSLRLVITAPKNAKDGASVTITVDGESKGGGNDTVKAKVTVKTSAGDQDSQSPSL